MKVIIYVLKHPVSKEVGYVGKTINIKARYTSHLSNAKSGLNTPVSAWVRVFIKRGQKPLIEKIEECDVDCWEERERFWIKYYRSLGKIYNIHDGGQISCHVSTSKGKGSGCYFLKSRGKWYARGTFEDARFNLGHFDNKEQAETAYKEFNINPYRWIANKRSINRSGVIAIKDEIIVEFKTILDCAEKIKGDSSAISACCRGKRKTHMGYTFSYVDRE